MTGDVAIAPDQILYVSLAAFESQAVAPTAPSCYRVSALEFIASLTSPTRC